MGGELVLYRGDVAVIEDLSVEVMLWCTDDPYDWSLGVKVML